MEDLTQSQVRTLEDEASLLKDSLHRLVPQVESARQVLDAVHLESDQRAALTEALHRAQDLFKQSDLLLERLDPAMRALRADVARTRRERDQLSTLYEISQALNSTLLLNPLLDMVMDRVIAVTGAERGFLALLDESGETHFAVARNMDRQDIEAQSFQVSRGIIARVGREGQPLLTDNASADPRFADRASVIYFGLRSIMAVPLRVKERVLGVVYVDNRIQSGLFSQQDLDLLTTFANQAAIAIDNARLFDDLQRTLEEISEIKGYMEDVFASVDSGILSTDLVGIVTTCNRAAARILALPEMEARNRHFLELFDEQRGGELSSTFVESLQRESHIRDYEVTCTVPQRGQITLKLQITPLKDSQERKIGVTMVMEDLTDERRYQQALNRYLPPAVAQEALRMMATGELSLGGTRRVMSILFADIRGFTSYSENVAPEELVDVLNRYLTVAARAIREQDGTLDKFMGDAVMALFNVPVPQPDHALRAVQAALAMQNRIAELNAGKDRYVFHFGVGIHVGEAVAGNIGSPERLDYTAIGDAVNLARRLQENAEGGQILLSEAAYREVAPWVEVNSLGPLTVKGRAEPVLVYELLALRPPPAAELPAAPA